MLLEALGAGRKHHLFQALEDVSFDVAPGEVVGIMGRNGAGKSTLLRIIAGTLEPSAGSVKVDGRVSAILELGSGFHSDYSGRENVYLGGLCMGLSREEIARKFDEIVAFAELEEFIDRPFRTYSSGMQARLTFAVATSVDPDVLIIDEALSVGDARFSLKSFDRVREFKKRGKAILFVSHSINQIVSICDRTILLERGKKIAEGEPNKIGHLYHELLFGASPPSSEPAQEEPWSAPEVETSQESQPLTSTQPSAGPQAAALQDWPSMLETSTRLHRYGDGRMEILKAAVLTPQGQAAHLLNSGSVYILRMECLAHVGLRDYCVGTIIKDNRGVEIFGTDTRILAGGYELPQLERGDVITIDLLFTANLAAGAYFFTIGLATNDEIKYDLRFDALEVQVLPTPHLYSASLTDVGMSLHIASGPMRRPRVRGATREADAATSV